MTSVMYIYYNMQCFSVFHRQLEDRIVPEPEDLELTNEARASDNARNTIIARVSIFSEVTW